MMQTTKKVSLGYTPREWQRQVHHATERFRVLAVHRRGGKTKAAIMELIDAGLKAERESLYGYVAPFLKQATAIAWAELKRTIEPLRVLGGVEISEGNLEVTFNHNQAVIRLFGADNPDALRGLRFDGVVLDEPAWMKPTAWTEVIQPALADRLGWALFIGTPSGIDLFSELYHKAPSLEDWTALRFTVYETDALPSKEVARLQREMPSNAFRREFLCDFNASADDQLISLSDVDFASKRVYGDRDYMHSPKVIGVDPARFGDDRSVICKRQGLVALKPIVLDDIDNMALAARIAQEIEQWQADAVFIDSGGGAGVIDRLRQLGQRCMEVPFGGKSLKPDLFINRRTEMWCEMGEWLKSGGAIPNNPNLKQELATPIFSYDNQGRKVLEQKSQIKKRLPGAGSPDIADALALTFAAPVAPRGSGAFGSAGRKAEEHDPYCGL